MENKKSVKTIYETPDDENSQEIVTKLILENLIQKYSREKIIDEINTIASKKDNEIILRDKTPLDSKDIISIIFKTVGSVKLYKALLEISQSYDETPKREKAKTKIRTEKFISMKRSTPLYSTEEEEEKPKSVKKVNHIKIIPNPNKNEEGYVVEMDKIAEKMNKGKNIVRLNENDETVFELNKREKGKNSKKLEKPVFVSLNDNSSEMNQKEKEKEKNKKILGFHYSLNEGNLYKFKVKDIYSDSASFICDDPFCKAFGIFSIENKSFKLVREHTVAGSEHSYNKEMAPKDINVLNYMKARNIDDMQLTKTQ